MSKPLRELLPGVLQRASATRKSAEHLQRSWTAAVGARAAAHAKVVALRKGVVYVQTEDAGLHFLLSMEKPRVLQRMSHALGQPVTDLAVRAGE